MKNNTLTNLVATLAFSAALIAPTASFARTQDGGQAKEMSMKMMSTHSSMFKGIEVNKGHVILNKEGNKTTLTLSPDFALPKTPAPHWQIVDSKGNVYLLKQLKIAGDKMNKSITLPSYIMDVAKVQIWCSFAEVNLGEVSFPMMEKGR